MSSELNVLAEILRPTDALVISDEVYEHMIYDGARHASIVEHPELYERGVAVFSFGKTMHATGWRVGYAVAPPDVTREIRRVHQFNTFSIAHPLQLAIERGFRQGGPAGYGLRRQLVAADGTLKGLLAPGEHKSIQTDRVVLAPGPPEERMFFLGPESTLGPAPAGSAEPRRSRYDPEDPTPEELQRCAESWGLVKHEIEAAVNAAKMPGAVTT